MPLAYRIVKPRHEAGAWTGEAAAKYGGRWNSRGVRVVYCGGSLSLAALELLVHLDGSAILDRYRWATVEIDPAQVMQLDAGPLPRNWSTSPAPTAVRRIGDEWVAGGRSVALRVPSAVVAGEHNFLLNPLHPNYAALRRSSFADFRFDPRLRGGAS